MTRCTQRNVEPVAAASHSIERALVEQQATPLQQLLALAHALSKVCVENGLSPRLAVAAFQAGVVAGNEIDHQLH